MDWAALIVGILAFIGVAINLIVNCVIFYKTKKTDKNQFDDKYAREIITNSRKEWLKEMKNTLSEFLACTTNFYNTYAGQDMYKDMSREDKVSELYYKLIFNLNPIGSVDRTLRNLLKLYFATYNNGCADGCIDKVIDESIKVEREFSYYFKAEWQRIQDYAKYGENRKFDFDKAFKKIKDDGDKQYNKYSNEDI